LVNTVIVVRVKQFIVIVHGIGFIVSGSRSGAKKGLAVPVKEFKPLSAATGHFVDSGNHIFWHWQLCPSRSRKESACVKVKEVIAPLVITGWTKGNGADSASGHGVIMVLLDLGICPKFNATVFVEVNATSGHNVAWTQSGGYPVWMGEGI
jgi:hypothetical protein